MVYNYSKLKGRIVELFGTQRNFAKAIDMSERTVNLKMNNKVAFTQGDIEKILVVLKLKDRDIKSYFFTKDVQNN